VARFGEIVHGMDALAHVAVWEKLFGLTSPRPGAIDGREDVPAPIARGERTQVMAAIAGIDIALWDIKGKRFGVPVSALLGGPLRDHVQACATGLYRRKSDEDAADTPATLRAYTADVAHFEAWPPQPDT